MKPLLKIAQFVQALFDVDNSMRITYTEEEMTCECKGFVKKIPYNILEAKEVDTVVQEFFTEYRKK